MYEAELFAKCIEPLDEPRITLNDFFRIRIEALDAGLALC